MYDFIFKNIVDWNVRTLTQDFYFYVKIEIKKRLIVAEMMILYFCFISTVIYHDFIREDYT